VPVLSSACGDAEEIIGAEKIVPVGNSEALAAKLLQTLGRNKDNEALDASH